MNFFKKTQHNTHCPQISTMSTKKAVFLDRDGTLNIDYGYVFEPKNIQLIDQTRQAIDIFIKQNFMLFLFTNQPGIERKMYTLEDVKSCNEELLRQLGIDPFQEICIASEAEVAPHNYRKPSPKFINEMIEKYQLNREFCYMVGDKESDAMAGINAGIHGILLNSTYPKSESCQTLIANDKIKIFENLIDFARIL